MSDSGNSGTSGRGAATVLRLASSQEKPVRACATCRYAREMHHVRFAKCAATGHYISTERNVGFVCGPEGRMWEAAPPKPPRTPGIFERAWKWLFGG